VASYQENIELARKKVKILILSIIFCDIHIQFNGYRLLLKYRKGENFRCICFVVYFLWFLHILFFCYFGELIDFHYDGDVLLVK
jgi:type III secretory pathway component EscU